MNGMKERRGSALLIVLGMMSFIVVSAVAFATYMRYSRLPSSYLRRTSASRMLAKAALAESIEVLDRAIGNNPYPGVGNQQSRLSDGNLRNYNIWRDRVFIGYDNESDYPTPEQTVSTLNMEALAYLPPSFINEVRYWSRRSMGGEWHKLSFDAGRYAFTAVNVSDCFDINRVSASLPRDSSDLGRISLSHMFRGPYNQTAPVTGSQWDTFINNLRTSQLPLVSVADMNLALAANGGPVTPPFIRYLQQGQNAKFVQGTTGAQATFDKAMAFVTDSYFPLGGTNEVNLCIPDMQPFYGFQALRSNPTDRNADTLDAVINSGSSDFLDEFLGPIEAVQLYDYLDGNSIPLSLALPTYERTPMITGVLCDGQLNLQMRGGAVGPWRTNGNGGAQSQHVRFTPYTLELNGMLAVEPSFVFPFNDDRGSNPSFSAQAAMTITFVPAGSENRLRVGANATDPLVVTKNGWSNSAQQPTAKAASGDPMPIVVTALSQPQAISIPSTITEEEQASLKLSQPFTFNFNHVPFAREVPEAFPQDSLPAWARGFELPNGTATLLKCERETLDEYGNPVQGSQVAEFAKTALRVANNDLSGAIAPVDGVKYVPVVQVWVRILNSNGKVVDLVPACGDDDEQPWSGLGQISSSSRARPLLRFFPAGSDATDSSVSGDSQEMIDKFAPGVPINLKYKAYLADDPRFNYAPENLIALDQVSGDLKDTWFSQQRSADREGDLFMMTSDAGYLQSPYELMALSVIGGSLERDGANNSAAYNGGGFNGQVRTTFADTPANAAMWRTYSEYNHNGRSGDISRLGIDNGLKGFRVNPYTTDPTIMYAALGNTPLGWHEASTNLVNRNDQITYSDDNSAREKFHELADKAIELMGQSAGTTRTWESVFNRDFEWDEDDRIAGVDFSSVMPLYSTDKKFLYGYWRECFSNAQQLFLLFIRAEPMMMGGGGLGQTPPQLGARAVALVWRDPTPTPMDTQGGSQSGQRPRPHKTRVLFYRQLD